jgi:hypothetical protein
MMQPPHPKSQALAMQAELQLLVPGLVASARFRCFNCAQRRFPFFDAWVAAARALMNAMSEPLKGLKSSDIRLSD